MHACWLSEGSPTQSMRAVGCAAETTDAATNAAACRRPSDDFRVTSWPTGFSRPPAPSLPSSVPAPCRVRRRLHQSTSPLGAAPPVRPFRQVRQSQEHASKRTVLGGACAATLQAKLCSRTGLVCLLASAVGTRAFSLRHLSVASSHFSTPPHPHQHRATSSTSTAMGFRKRDALTGKPLPYLLNTRTFMNHTCMFARQGWVPGRETKQPSHPVGASTARRALPLTLTQCTRPTCTSPSRARSAGSRRCSP